MFLQINPTKRFIEEKFFSTVAACFQLNSSRIGVVTHSDINEGASSTAK